MHPSLARLDQALECPICKHAFVAPVSLACGHSFCSRCVRDALQERKECPICREEAREGHVRRNRVLEELVGAWTAARDDVLRISQDAQRKRKSPAPATTSVKRKRIEEPASVRRPAAGRSMGGAIVLDLDGSTDEEAGESVSGGSEGPITCPACAQQVPLPALNTHLDLGCPRIQPPPTTQKASWAALFSRPSSSSSAAADADAELLGKRISKPNYALVTPKELRGVLETYGCPTGGERQTLVERVQLWISLFNANLDAAHPRPLKALRAELDVQERARARDRDDAARAKAAFVNATGDDEAFRRIERELKRRKG